ncbi:uncharacterized protein VTP21DRAFT_9211 [Calcarisporiella thermophila]|uniref:uncharacterized protein n=1 Tax=Calcarisporiella thermophila TaxID=911321 RepID=UPI003742EC09
MSSTCRHLSYLTRTDTLWAELCKKLHPTLNTLGPPFQCFREFYAKLLHRYGSLIGHWCGDLKYRGEFLFVVWDMTKGAITGMRLVANNEVHGSTPWSLDPGVRIRHVDVQYGQLPRFFLRLHPLTGQIVCNTRPMLEQEGNVAIRRAKFYSNIETELWISRESYSARDEYELCDEGSDKQPINDCFALSIRSPRQSFVRHERYARLDLKRLLPQPDCMFQGLFVGDYDGHGMEFLLMTYYEGSKKLYASKITGDINVPRGEVSWIAFMHKPLRVASEKEFEGMNVYEGRGQCAEPHFIDECFLNIEGRFKQVL